MKILLVTFLFSMNAYTINWEKCGQFRRKSSPYGLLVSTSSFFTSTGDCAMIGMAGHDKKVFIAHNLDYIQTDSARGQGEYLSAYASLSGCSETGTKQLGSLLQKKYVQIFGGTVENSPKQVHEGIEKLIRNNTELKNSCHQQG